MTESQDPGRIARLERRLKMTQVAFAILVCAQLVWTRTVANREWCQGPPMSTERVEALAATLYLTDHPLPPGPEENPRVREAEDKFMVWHSNFQTRYRAATRKQPEE